MLRFFLGALCFTAAASQFTLDKLGEMSTSIQKTAEELQDKVVAISKEINPLALKITTLPAQMAAPNANKAEIQKELKSTAAEVCSKATALSQVQAEIEKDSADTKDTVAKITAQITEMSKDPKKSSDGMTFQHYVSKFQKAIATLDAAATTAKPLTALKAGACGDATTRLFALSPQQPSFHVPSALMGALGATVLGASALVVSRAGSRSHSSVALMEEGTLE